MSKMTGRIEYHQKAIQINRSFAGIISKSPSAFSQTLTGIDFTIGPAYEIVISSTEYDHSALLMINAIRQIYLPHKIILLRTNSNNLGELAGFVSIQTPVDGKATVYICKNFACDYPITDYKKIEDTLK
jgi:hypothetical protein